MADGGADGGSPSDAVAAAESAWRIGENNTTRGGEGCFGAASKLVAVGMAILAFMLLGFLALSGVFDGDDQEAIDALPPIEEVGTLGGAGTASATLGRRTWEFFADEDRRSICQPNVGGQFLVNMFTRNEAGEETVLVISAPAGGGDAVVSVGDPTIMRERYVADSGIDFRLGNVQGIQRGSVGAVAAVDGNRISGVGNFYEARALEEARAFTANYDAGVFAGSFEAECE